MGSSFFYDGDTYIVVKHHNYTETTSKWHLYASVNQATTDSSSWCPINWNLANKFSEIWSNYKIFIKNAFENVDKMSAIIFKKSMCQIIYPLRRITDLHQICDTT